MIRLDQKQQNELQEKKDHDKFNSITQKNKVENQNQMHNARKEGIAPINKRDKASVRVLFFMWIYPTIMI